jgi:hypothetical protein
MDMDQDASSQADLARELYASEQAGAVGVGAQADRADRIACHATGATI